MKVNEQESRVLWVIKGLALISVFYAHTARNYGYHLLEALCECLGLIGVPTFFVVSGYLFNKPNNIAVFIKKKIKSVIIPWLICSTATYCLSIVINNQDITIVSYLKWVIGVQTWYYFVPVLLLIFIIFTFLDDVKYIIISVVLTISSLLMTQLCVGGGTRIFINNYLNVFNWIGFFGLGMLIRKRYIISVFKTKFIYPISIVAMLMLVQVFDITFYWSVQSLVFEVIGFITIVNIAFQIDRNKLISEMFQKIGKSSYFIYLIHMQLVGVINSRLHLESAHPILILIKPIVVFFIVVSLILFLIHVLDKLKLVKFMKILGIR